MVLRCLLLFAAGLLSCAAAPAPAQPPAAPAPAPEQPALYQLLYASGSLPSDREALQRVRALAWLRQMKLDAGQLDRLASLRALAVEQRARIAAAEREMAERTGPEEDRIYDQIWERLAAGAGPEDPALRALTEELRTFRAGNDRAAAVLKLRMESVRIVLEATHPLLDTLSPSQLAALNDSLFLLRHRLDPVGTPGDFEALVGSTYEAGQTGILLRGNAAEANEPLDIGGLWSDAAPDSPARRDALPEAKREALLYLALLEPGLEEAIGAVRDGVRDGVGPQP